MKQLLIVLLGILSSSAYAQRGVVTPQIICGIWYDYDAAGNRVKRYYDCKDPTIMVADPGGPLTPQGPLEPGVLVSSGYGSKGVTLPVDDQANGQTVRVFPNPITDRYSIKIPKATDKPTHFHVYDGKGAIVGSGEINGDLYEGSLGNVSPGNYMIVVYYDKTSYHFPVVKL